MGLMMSILVFSVGVLEALACFEHIRQGYLPLDLGRKRRRLVLDVASGTIRHRETRRSSEFQRDTHLFLQTLPSALEDDNERDDDELQAIFQSVETGQVHSTQTSVPQDHRFLSIDDVEENDSCASSEISRTSTPNTVIFNAGQEDNSELGLAFEPCYIPPENDSEYHRLNSNSLVINVEKVPPTLSNDIRYHQKQNVNNNNKSQNDQVVNFSSENNKTELIESTVTKNVDFKLLAYEHGDKGQCSYELRPLIILENIKPEISSNNREINCSHQPNINEITPRHYKIENSSLCESLSEIGETSFEDSCFDTNQPTENTVVLNDRNLERNKIYTNIEINFSNNVRENLNFEEINLKNLEPPDPLQKSNNFCELSSHVRSPKTSASGVVSAKSVISTNESDDRSLSVDKLLADHVIDEKPVVETQDSRFLGTIEGEKQPAQCQVYDKTRPIIENKDVGVRATDSNSENQIGAVMQINADRIKHEELVGCDDSNLLGSQRPDSQTKTNVSPTETIIHHQIGDGTCYKTVCDTPDKLINNKSVESITNIEVEDIDLKKSDNVKIDKTNSEDLVQILSKELPATGILTSGAVEIVEGIQESIEVVEKNVNDITQLTINNNTSTNDLNLISKSVIEPDGRTVIVPEETIPMNKNFTLGTDFYNIKEGRKMIDFTTDGSSNDTVFKDIVEVQCPVNEMDQRINDDYANKDIVNSVVNITLDELKNLYCKSNQDISHELRGKENSSPRLKKSVVIEENSLRYSMNDVLSRAEEIVDQTVTKSIEYLNSKNKMALTEQFYGDCKDGRGENKTGFKEEIVDQTVTKSIEYLNSKNKMALAEQFYGDRKDERGENKTGFKEEETLKELLDVKDNLKPIPQKESAVEKSVQKKDKGVLRKQETLDMSPFADDVVVLEGAVPSKKDFTPVGDITSPERAFWLIFSGEYTKAMSKDWHSGHFCCWQCDESLTGQRYVLRDDHPYCIKCYEQVFANTCDECSKVIGIDSKDLSYKDKHWHEACFLCSKCRVSLVDKQFGSKADKIYCGNCYDAQFASRCDGCGQIFRAGTKKMEYKTRQWHEQCFCCCVCKSAIGTKSFIPREQEIYCATCYEEKFATRCVKCNKIITSGGVTYKNEPWHRECFTCTNCSTSLAGQRFTSRDEKPYCADCFGELFAKRCTACCKPITGIGGTRFISFEDRHWHNDCFICASCRSSLVGRGFITDAEDILCTECAKQKLM